MKKYLISGFNTVQDVKLEAGTYTLVAYAKSMYSNVYTFALGDGENWTEYDIDVVQGQLCKVWLTFTIDKRVTKFKPIANNFSESLPVYVADLQLTKGNIPVEAGASPFDIDKILNDLHDGIDAIEDFTEGAFLDGLLSREEKTQLRASLDSIGAIVESVKGSYNKLLDNPFIHENTMDNITARYYAFIASWISDGDPRGLKPVILWIVNGDNIVSQNEREEKDRALNAFNDALYAYNQSEKEVYSDMGDDYTEKIDDAIIKATYWVIDSSSPIIYKDASAYNISGYHKPVTVRGELRRGEDVTIGGFITVTPNGLAEGSPKASPVEIAPLNNAGREMYTIKLYNDLNKTKLLDEMTIPVALSGSRGVDAINVTMSNESDTVPADADGLVRDYTGTGTNIRVFEGTTELEYGASTNGQYTVIGSSNTVTIGSIIKSGIHCKVNDAIFIDNDKASILFTVSGKTINGDSFSIEKKQSITRVRTGEDAPLLYLSPSSQVMVCDSDNNSKPNQNIEVKAKLQNVTGTATFTAIPYIDNGIALANITLGGSGNLRTLKSNQWLSTFNKVEVIAMLGDLSDTVTIHRLADAENSITGYLTNENITLQASSTGVVSSSSFANAIGVFKVHDGELVVSSGVDYSSVSQSGCTVSIDALGAYKVLTMPADDAIAKFKAVYKNVEIIRELKLSKSKQGDEGEDGITISPNQQGYTYRADLNGDIIGSLANGMVELTITSGSTPITCSSTSGGTPTTNGTYRVTRTLGNGITTNQSLSDGKYRITPATLTVDEASVELEIKIMMGGVVTSYPLILTYRKQFDGADGKSTEFIFKGSKSDTTAPTLPSTSQQDDWYGQGTANEWNDDLIEPTKTLPYVWASQRKKVDSVWGAFTTPKVWLRWTEDGDGITSTTIHYAKRSIGTTPPSDGWSTSLPTPTQGWYLWTRTTTTYKVAETTVSYSVSHWAEDGDGIVSTTIHYQKSSSGTAIPGSWLTSLPTPTKGWYLWTRTTTVYKLSPNTVAYSISYWAKDGDKGDKGEPPKILNGYPKTQYAIGDSKTIYPTIGWGEAMIEVTESKPYLWSRQEIKYDSGDTLYTGYLMLTNITPIPYMAGEWDMRVAYTRNDKSYPIVTYKRGTNNRPLYYYPKKEGVIEYIQFVKPDVNYSSTWYNQNDLVWYENDGSNGDPVCPLGIFKSKYNNNRYLPTTSSWWDNVTADYAPNGVGGQKLWEFADGVELIITEAMMANFAKLDSFVFNDGKMFSQEGILNGVAGSVDYTNKDHKPNFEIDGKTGLMKFGKNIHFGMKNGYAVLEYYDNDGQLLYDLGPNGLGKLLVRAEGWTELKKVRLTDEFSTSLDPMQLPVGESYKDMSNATIITCYRYTSAISEGVNEDLMNDGRIFNAPEISSGRILDSVYCDYDLSKGFLYPTKGTNSRLFGVDLPKFNMANEPVYDRYGLYYRPLQKYASGVIVGEINAYWNHP